MSKPPIDQELKTIALLKVKGKQIFLVAMNVPEMRKMLRDYKPEELLSVWKARKLKLANED